MPLDQPWLAGPTVDRVGAAVLSFFGSVLGMIAVIVLIWVWAAQPPSAPARVMREAHARSVSIAALIGGLVVPAVALALMLWLTIAGMSAVH